MCITRYNTWPDGVHANEDGDYVLYSDHVEEVEKLQQTVNELHSISLFQSKTEGRMFEQLQRYREALEQIVLGQYTAQGCKDIAREALKEEI